MSSRVTIADVARLAGVHVSTVSRSLNKDTESQVNHETLIRVRQAAKRLGYAPSSIARENATSVFSGRSTEAPRWAMISIGVMAVPVVYGGALPPKLTSGGDRSLNW